MTLLPPSSFIAELPLKAPAAGALRLLPGQLFRGRITSVGEGKATLDLRYAALEVKLKPGATLTVGQRVLVQVQDVGPQRLALSLQPLPTAPLPTITATASDLLAGLGFPTDDPLLQLAASLQRQPAAAGLPPPLLAALVLTFGAEAGALLPRIASMLRQRASARAGSSPTVESLEGRTAAQREFLGLLDQLLRDTEPHAESARGLAGAWQQMRDSPEAQLSLALSAMAGHGVRYHQEQQGSWSLIVEERGKGVAENASISRFLARVNLPALGAVSVHCLLSDAGCLGRLTTATTHRARLEGEIATAAATLTQSLGRPVHLTVERGEARDPLAMWLEEAPWLTRGLSAPAAGEWLDTRA